MVKNLKLQLQLVFEQELLRNRSLRIVNTDDESDEAYVGSNILNEECMLDVEFDEVLDILSNAINHLLENGAVENIYHVFFNEDPDDIYANYPSIYCTDVRSLSDAIKEIYDVAVSNDDYLERKYVNDHLYVYMYYYENGELVVHGLY